MALKSEPPIEARAPREQIVYANLLTMGVWSGIFILFVTYLIYVSGLLSPHVPLETVPEHWGKGVDDYMAATGSPRGWEWAELLLAWFEPGFGMTLGDTLSDLLADTLGAVLGALCFLKCR